ncbi:MAG: flagellar motor switch protein FliN [Spirochaetales bacterium]|nr:flagellar motor switch protein FliN [Spirochaetales bacterium]
MSDGSLSQDEIDALLQGGGGMDMGAPEPVVPMGMGGTGLTDAEKQEFLGLIEGLLSSQVSNLNNLINDTVELVNPVVDVTDNSGIAALFPGDIVEINLDFQEGMSGKHSYLLEAGFAENMAGMMMGMDGVELSEAAFSALGEAGNTLAGTTSTAFGDKIGQTIMPTPGDTHKVDGSSFNFQSGPFVKVEYQITVDSKPPSTLVELYDLAMVKSLLTPDAAEPLGGGLDLADMASLEAATGGAGGMDMGAMGGGMDMGGMGAMGGGMNMGGMGGQSQMQQNQMGTGQMPQQMGGMNMGGMNMGGYGMGQPNMGVQSVQFPGLNPQTGSGDQGNIGLLMDVYMEMTVELGRTKRLIKDILGMGEGTIIELDKLAGEPVDILVNHKLIAKGEVVVIDENFGVRVTEIVSPLDRMGDYT